MSKWDKMKQFLAGYLQTERQYKAGAIYQAYTEEHGTEISRKDFEMFLRSEVISDNGMLKRASHGVYEIRTDPADRGVLFTRGKTTTEVSDPTDDILYSQYRIDPAKENLDAILDDALCLTARIRAVLEHVEDTPYLWATERKALSTIRANTLNSMDSAVSGLTAAMAWCEDHLDEAPAEQSLDAGMKLM